MKLREAQFEEIYNSNYPIVFRLCQGYTNGDEALSKDLAQEVFIKVWENLISFRNEASISTWIYRITVNCCLLELRNKKSVSIDNHLSHLEDTETNVIDHHEVQLKQMHQCISTLKTENKTIILLELEGLPQKEIADIMGLSHQTIRVRIHRIKNELIKCVTL